MSISFVSGHEVVKDIKFDLQIFWVPIMGDPHDAELPIDEAIKYGFVKFAQNKTNKELIKKNSNGELWCKYTLDSEDDSYFKAVISVEYEGNPHSQILILRKHDKASLLGINCSSVTDNSPLINNLKYLIEGNFDIIDLEQALKMNLMLNPEHDKAKYRKDFIDLFEVSVLLEAKEKVSLQPRKPLGGKKIFTSMGELNYDEVIAVKTYEKPLVIDLD